MLDLKGCRLASTLAGIEVDARRRCERGGGGDLSTLERGRVPPLRSHPTAGLAPPVLLRWRGSWAARKWRPRWAWPGWEGEGRKAKAFSRKRKTIEKKKKEKDRKEKGKKYIKIYLKSLEAYLIAQNWLHNFGMQRKSPKIQTVQSPIQNKQKKVFRGFLRIKYKA